MVIDSDDPKRKFTAHVREGVGQLILADFDPENKSFKRTDSEVIKEQQKMADRILSVLRLNPQGLSGRGIIECLGMTKEEGKGVYTALSRMEAKLLVSTTKSPSDKCVTLYTSTCGDVTPPIRKYPLPPPTQPSNCWITSKTHTQQDLQDIQQKNQNIQQNTENIQQLFDTSNTEEHLKPSPHMGDEGFLNLSNNFPTEGGEGGVFMKRERHQNLLSHKIYQMWNQFL